MCTLPTTDGKLKGRVEEIGEVDIGFSNNGLKMLPP